MAIHNITLDCYDNVQQGNNIFLDETACSIKSFFFLFLLLNLLLSLHYPLTVSVYIHRSSLVNEQLTTLTSKGTLLLLVVQAPSFQKKMPQRLFFRHFSGLVDVHRTGGEILPKSPL